ncbi:aminoacyl-tRNA deacylase [Psychromicrobium silvestre]|uniref:aminoacyl-tRNA deacylase n=1 Tax=Psychromicrobium silvestre TaxID=1645614 RepID=UPI001C545D99|nr:aminoacyl-tRNA deacylase [Psychromicrobium silvestre]
MDAAGVVYNLHSYRHDAAAPSYGIEAAKALGVPEPRVFKTLMVAVTAELGTELVAAVVPVSGNLDLKALATTLHAKRAELADPWLAQRRTGYVLGGISPLGSKLPHPTVLDESALEFSTIFCSAGRRGLELEIAPTELARLSSAVLARIAKN